uniref:F-box associated beta-propeller type 3 domain-containing protein n=1 Tax=Fagus sylvatica TaxID=28930 RepID=A0A2N9EPY9_FAGSY
MLAPTHLTHPFESISTRPLTSVAVGFGFHSQNNDFKILRIVCYNKEVEAEVYTLSTDTWRRVVISLESEPNIGSIDEIVASPCLFFNGALHSLAYSRNHKFILSFDVNDEIFHAIELPQNLDGAGQHYERLTLFTGCLAFIVCNEDADADIWHILGDDKVCGELLIEIFDGSLDSFDFENLNVKHLRIRSPPWLGYTTDLMESLVFLDQAQGQDLHNLLPTWTVPMYRSDGSVVETTIPRCTDVGYPISQDSRQPTFEDLVESLKLEMTRLSRELYMRPQKGAYGTGDSEETTSVSGSKRRREC